MQRRYLSLVKYSLAFLIFSLAAIYITYPLIFHLGEYATGLGDELLIAWIQNWNIHAFMTNPLRIFDANIFYPYNNSLAFSETFITSSILSIIPSLVFGEPIVATNFTLFSSLIFLGFCTFILVNYLTKDFFPSLFSGFLIIFSPVTLDKAVHLQILSIQWIPLSILFFVIFLQKKGKTQFLLMSMAFFVLQTYNSFLPGYFLVVLLSCISIFFYFQHKKKFLGYVTKKNIFIVGAGFLLIVPIALPYFQVSAEHAFKRDIREAIHLALQPEDLFYSSSYSRFSYILNPIQANIKYTKKPDFKPGFLGLTLTLFSAVVLYVFFKYFKKQDWIYKGLVVSGLVGLILSLGPALHLGRQTIHYPFPIPLPYALFYYVIPGFQGLRNAFRWEMLFAFCMAVASGLLLYRISKNWKKRKIFSVYPVLLMLIVIEFNFPLQSVRVPEKKEFPAVYSYIATTEPNSKIIEMPIYNWDMFPYSPTELLRVYYSTSHFRKTVNGASGFSPPRWQAIARELLSDFPSDSSLLRLRKMGISYIIVHKDEYDRLHKEKFSVDKKSIGDGGFVVGQLNSDKRVRLKKRFGKDYVYQIL